MQQKTECTATFHRFVIGPAPGESGGTAGGGPLAPGEVSEVRSLGGGEWGGQANGGGPCKFCGSRFRMSEKMPTFV